MLRLQFELGGLSVFTGRSYQRVCRRDRLEGTLVQHRTCPLNRYRETATMGSMKPGLLLRPTKVQLILEIGNLPLLQRHPRHYQGEENNERHPQATFQPYQTVKCGR